MKKYEHMFPTKEDRIIFPTLIRSMKETGYHLNKPIKSIIESCIGSRNSHPNETFYLNTSFWPKDTGYFRHSYSALFVSRLINAGLIKQKIFTDGAFVTNFVDYLNSFDARNQEALKEVHLAISKMIDAGVSNHNLRKAVDYFNLNNHKKQSSPYQI